jgi:hypothetical protein
MTLKSSTFSPPPASYLPPTAPPPAPTASSASAYPPPPPPPTAPSTSASANILELQEKFRDLPTFMYIYKKNLNGQPYTALVVEWNDLFFLDTNKKKKEMALSL